MKLTQLILILPLLASVTVCGQTLIVPGTISNNTTNSNVGIGTANPPVNAKLEVVGPSTGSGATFRASGGGDVVLNPGGSLFFDGNYSYASGNYIRPMASNVQSFFTSGEERLRINANGNVGIGTSTPMSKLSVAGSIYSGAAQTNTIYDGAASSGPNLIGSQGYWAVRTATDNSFNLDVYNPGGSPKIALNVTQGGIVNIGGETSVITGYGARLSLLGASTNGDYLYFQRYNNGADKTELRVNIGDDYGQSEDMFVVGTYHWEGGAWHPHLAVQASGNVGIGTTTPDTKLTVKGVIHTNEVRVDLNSPIDGPDYVFEKGYDLLSLAELETYIKANKHLPEVPSAKEMEANGLNLKEMNLLLLKKVEELTLHLIEINKKVELYHQENQDLKKQVLYLKK